MWIYIGHFFTRPMTSVFSGKADRLIKTLDKQMENRKKTPSANRQHPNPLGKGVTFDVKVLPRLYVAW